MGVTYFPGDRDDNIAPYWRAKNPTNKDLLLMMRVAGSRNGFYNMAVTGTPSRISPEWIARHPGYNGENYEYAASYSIYEDDLAYGVDNYSNPVEIMNWYLEGFGKKWLEIDEIKITDSLE